MRGSHGPERAQVWVAFCEVSSPAPANQLARSQPATAPNCAPSALIRWWIGLSRLPRPAGQAWRGNCMAYSWP